MAETRAFNNGAGVGFDHGAAMLYNMKAPFFNAQTARAQTAKSNLNTHVARTRHRGVTTFLCVNLCASTPKMGPVSAPMSPKIRPQNSGIFGRKKLVFGYSLRAKIMERHFSCLFSRGFMQNFGSQHPSPNVKTLCNSTSSRKFGQRISNHVMPKVLVLKAQGRHVM